MTAVRFPGTVIHSTRERDLELQVVDTSSSRSLHFGSLSRQSSMWLSAPTRLQLPYTRAMMSALLFCPAPRRVLSIGLGGGSLAKFLLQEFPDCVVDAVESSPAVVDVAYRLFQLPRSERLRVHITRGESFVAELPETARYDFILADAFLAHGSATCMQRSGFFAACARHLCRPEGVLVTNLWRGRNTGYVDSLEALREAFGRPPLRLPVGGRGNVVAVSPCSPCDRRDLSRLRGRAHTLQQRLDLTFPAYLQTLSDSATLWQRLLARI